MVDIEGVPKTWVANQQSINSESAAAAESFVVVVARLSCRGGDLKVAPVRGIGMAKNGKGGAIDALVLLAEFGKNGHFRFDLGKNKRGIELEADIVNAEAGDGNEAKASSVEFGGSGRSNEELKEVGIRMLAEYAAVGRRMDVVLLIVVRHGGSVACPFAWEK